MLSDKVKKYIDEHSFCSECLFKDWEPFLDLLYAEGGAVSAICWWDHCKKSEQRRSVESGGYNDPSDPEYLYAETHICAEGLGAKTLDEIKEYIVKERETGFQFGHKYFSHDLIPAFYFDE